MTLRFRSKHLERGDHCWIPISEEHEKLITVWFQGNLSEEAASEVLSLLRKYHKKYYLVHYCNDSDNPLLQHYLSIVDANAEIGGKKVWHPHLRRQRQFGRCGRGCQLGGEAYWYESFARMPPIEAELQTSPNQKEIDQFPESLLKGEPLDTLAPRTERYLNEVAEGYGGRRESRRKLGIFAALMSWTKRAGLDSVFLRPSSDYDKQTLGHAAGFINRPDIDDISFADLATLFPTELSGFPQRLFSRAIPGWPSSESKVAYLLFVARAVSIQPGETRFVAEHMGMNKAELVLPFTVRVPATTDQLMIRAPYLVLLQARMRRVAEWVDGYAQPIHNATNLTPIDSDKEREAADFFQSILELINSIYPQLHIAVEKPLFPISTSIGPCKPDFLLVALAADGRRYTLVVEVVGIDTPEYWQNKASTHPRMRRLGKLIINKRFGNKSESNADLMNQVQKFLNKIASIRKRRN